MSRLEREIIAQKNDDVFKSGIGDIDDLKILADYDRAHTENFQIGLTLVGHTLEKSLVYPKLDIDYSIKASGTRNVETVDDPADYDFDIVFEPELKASCRLVSYDPVLDEPMDSYVIETTIRKEEGNKKIYNLKADCKDINRKAMTFFYVPKMVTKERGAFYVHRYSDFSKWNQISNSKIGSSQRLHPGWSFNRRNGTVSIGQSGYSFGMITSSESIFRGYKNFTVSADISLRVEPSSLGQYGFSGISFCIKDSENFYFAGVENKDEDIVLFKVVNNVKTELARKKGDILKNYGKALPHATLLLFDQTSTTYNLAVDVLENNIRVYIDDTLVLQYTDDQRIDAGGFGLASYNLDKVTFSNIIFDRYVILEDVKKQEFLKYGETEKQLTSNDFNSIFNSALSNRYYSNPDVITSWATWYEYNKDKCPKRKHWTFGNLNHKLNDEFIVESSTYEHKGLKGNEEWISGWTKKNTTKLHINITEFGQDYKVKEWIFYPIFYKTVYKYKYNTDYSIYYQKHGSSSWVLYDRIRDTESGSSKSSKSRSIEISLPRGQYRLRVKVNNSFSINGSSVLIIYKWTATQDRFYVDEPVFISRKEFAYTDIIGSNFVAGNNTTQYTDIPTAYLTGYPTLKDYKTCRVEIEDISPITIMENYAHYNSPLKWSWQSNGKISTTTDSDILILKTDFDIVRNMSGSITEVTRVSLPNIMDADPNYPDKQHYPDLDSVVTGNRDSIKIKLVNKHTDTRIEFEITRSQESTYHYLNGWTGNNIDNILIFPNPGSITTKIVPTPWPLNEEEEKMATIKVRAIVNGYFNNIEDGKYDYMATIDMSPTLKRDFSIQANRGDSISDVINLPGDIDLDTLEFTIDIDRISFQQYTLIPKDGASSQGDFVIVGETESEYIVKQDIEIDSSENINYYFESTGHESTPDFISDTIIISSDFMTDDYYLKSWKETIYRNGSISLKSPIWEITIPEKGKELKDYYNIPEGDIGQYAFIAECDSQLLSPSAIRINDKTFKAVVELANVMTWLPYIHNGYFYISDPETGKMPEEYYLYAIPYTKEFPVIKAGEIYELDEYPKQLSPIIVRDKNGNTLRRVTFIDEDFNLTLVKKERTIIKEEVEPSYTKITKENNAPVNVVEIKGNILYLDEAQVNAGETVHIEYSYKNSRRKSFDAVVDENFSVELPDKYINSIYLTYSDIKPDSIIVKDNESRIITVKEVNENFLELDTEENLKGKEVTAEYMLNNSFIINTFARKPQMIFSNDYKDGVTVTIENSIETAYYQEKEININPHINDINEGFIFISNKKPMLGYMNISAFPETIYSDGSQKVYLKVSLVDTYFNPFYNPDIKEPLILTCKHGEIQFIDYNGNIITGKRAGIPDRFGNVYAVYTFTGNATIQEDTIWGQYGVIASDKTIKINNKVIKDDLDGRSHTREDTDTEYHINIKPEKHIIRTGEVNYIKISLYDNNLVPLIDVPVTVEIKDSASYTTERLTFISDKDGEIIFTFYRNIISGDLNTFIIKATAVIDDVEITDITSVSVARM